MQQTTKAGAFLPTVLCFAIPWLFLTTWFFATAVAADEFEAMKPITVRPGDARLSQKHLEPFHARYREVVAVEGQSPRRSERFVHLQTARYPQGEGLRHVTSMVGSDTVYDEVRLLRDTLAPLVRHVSAASMMHRVEVFGEGLVRGVTTQADGSAAQPAEVTMDGKRFDGGSLDLVLARLPLEDGMVLRIPLFSSDMGAAHANLLAEVRVIGQETLDVAGTPRTARLVEVHTLDAEGNPLELPGGMRLPVAKKWLVAEAPYVLRTRWRPGHEMTLVDLWK